MNVEEANVILGRMRGTWPRMYLIDDGLDAWIDFFIANDFEASVFALQKLSRELSNPPSIKDFADIIEGEVAHRVKCPLCGVGFRTVERLLEHNENVHW